MTCSVAAGPRFLNGYTRHGVVELIPSVAAGPRFLNGYTKLKKLTRLERLPLDRDF